MPASCYARTLQGLASLAVVLLVRDSEYKVVGVEVINSPTTQLPIQGPALLAILLVRPNTQQKIQRRVHIPLPQVVAS